MRDLELDGDESVKKKYNDVGWDSGDGGHGGELYLTNKNLIFYYETGIFDRTSQIIKTPLTKIKNSKGSYSINYNDEEVAVEIYYPGGQDEYDFEEEAIAQEFINNLEECLSLISLNQNVESDCELMSEDNYRICSKCGKKNDSDANYCNNCGTRLTIDLSSSGDENETKNASIDKIYKCKSCGATLKGNIGEFVKCEYCDLIQELK